MTEKKKGISITMISKHSFFSLIKLILLILNQQQPLYF